MIFASRYLTEELRIQRAENARLRDLNAELIEKTMFNRQPERLIRSTPRPMVNAEASDALSLAERMAEEGEET